MSRILQNIKVSVDVIIIIEIWKSETPSNIICRSLTRADEVTSMYTPSFTKNKIELSFTDASEIGLRISNNTEPCNIIGLYSSPSGDESSLEKDLQTQQCFLCYANFDILHEKYI